MKKVNFAKQFGEFEKGVVSAESLSVGGNLNPKASNKLIDTIVDKSAFLKRITTDKMGKLKKDIDVWDMKKGILVRKAEGVAPTKSDTAEIENVGKQLDALGVQLFADVGRSTILNNQDNPKFMSDLNSRFAKKFEDELVYLGFIGEGNDGKAFKTLNKGWLHIVENSNDAIKGDYAKNASITSILTKLVQGIDDDVYDKSVIVMNPKDYLAYQVEIGNATPGIIINAEATKFLDKEIITMSYMPKGKMMATPLENLVFGISKEVARSRTYYPDKRIMQWVFDMNVDYEIAVDKYVSFMKAK